MSHPTLPQDYKFLLLDIEGTTTPISFVHDVLFPYAAQALEGYLSARWGEPALAPIIAQIKEDTAKEPQAPAMDDTPSLEQTLESLRWQMAHDKKMTGLKLLQGKLWRAGYESGQIQGALFDEVATVLGQKRAQGVRIFIYSSGSVEAQQLIFGYSVAGDLRPLLEGYFDTTTGPKKEAQSYIKIADYIGAAPEDILFATDNLDEAKAAHDAGLQVVVMDRPGNGELPQEHPFRELKSFERI